MENRAAHWAKLALALLLVACASLMAPRVQAVGADGYYTYSDSRLGQYQLALMAQRFMLVTETPDGLVRGTEGWLQTRGDTVLLSGPGTEAEGRLDGDILYLNLNGLSLPFSREGPAWVADRTGRVASAENIKAHAPGELPVTVWYWIAASIPLLTLIVLLAVLHWQPAPAAAVSAISAVVIAILLYGAPLKSLAVATGEAIWDAVFVMYVVWPALMLYSVIKEAKAFERIESAMESLISSRLLLILAVAWTFSSFIQGIVGEGVPLAITIPLMLQLRVKPVYAVLLPLLGRTWGNVFGSMGEGWLIALRVADIPGSFETAIYSALLLIIPNFLAGLGIAWIYGRGWAVRHGALAIVVITLVHSGVQLALAPFYPRIAGFAAAAAGLGAVFLLARWGPYRKQDRELPKHIFAKERDDDEEDQEKAPENMSLKLAFSPYFVLSALALVMLVFSPVREFLGQFSASFSFPATHTALGMEKPAEPAYDAFKIFIHPGTLIIIATICTVILYQRAGFFGTGATRRMVTRAVDEALPATTPFVALVLTAKVMELSGMMLVLALGTAIITSPLIYTFVSPFIGALGAFATSSTSGSLVLFTPLQVDVARALALPPNVVAAGQMAGAAAGNSLAALDILIGLLVVGKPRLLGQVLKKTAFWALLTLVLIGFGTMALYLLGAT